VETLNFRCIRR